MNARTFFVVLCAISTAACSSAHRDEPLVAAGSGGGGGDNAAGAGADPSGQQPDASDAMVEMSVACQAEARDCGEPGSRSCDTVMCPELQACSAGIDCRGICAGDCYPLPYCTVDCQYEGDAAIEALCSARDLDDCLLSDADGGASPCRMMPEIGGYCHTADASIEDAGPSSYDTLLECEAEAPCARSSSSVIENLRNAVDKPPFECVFSKLATGTPGKYVHDTSHSFTNGSGTAKHTFVVQEDGTVLYGSSKHATVSNPDANGVLQTMVESWQRVVRCELQPAAYFEDCQAKLAADESGTSAWSCVYGTADISLADQMPWVTNCQPVNELICP